MQNTKRTFWLIWLIALIPMLVAMSMYFSGRLTPSSTVNKGQLLSNQTLSQWQLSYAGTPWQHRGQWKILQTTQSKCDPGSCLHWQSVLPKVITGLGKDSDRVVMFQVGEGSDVLQTPKLQELGDAVWLVDPLGNLVLRYELSMQPEDLLKDLKKLLKISGIG